MAEITWSPQSLDDLDSIAEYIARDSARYAQSTVEKIIEAAEILKRFPRIGRVVPEMRDEDIREILHKNYRIIYELHGEKIEILTVLHGRRLFRL